MSNGGVHIPPDVRKFLEFTLGLSWPESDDQGLVALWKAWEAFEDAAGVYEAAARAAGVAIPQVLEGETGEFFAHFLSATIPDGVAGLGEAAGELAKMAQNAAADVYKTKVMFVVFAAFTLASIIHLMATLIGALFTGVVIAAARVALTAIWRALITRLGQLSLSGGLSQATKTALLKFAKDLAIKTGGFAAFGAALMGGTDFGVQARQIADGDRQGWDTKSLTSSFVGGALGGAFAGVFHSAAGAIRKTAFDLRDRLAIDPNHLQALVPDAAAKSVTAQAVSAAIDGRVAALGDAAYATGQFVTTVATAPLVNLALGAPTGNPALGALGSLSKYGGGRGGTGVALDTIHPPEIPDLTIPAVTEKPHAAEKPVGTEKPTKDSDKVIVETPEVFQAPPPYTALPTETDHRPEKSPAYTTNPQALGALYTAPSAAAANSAISTAQATASSQAPAKGFMQAENTQAIPAAETRNSSETRPATTGTGYSPAAVEASSPGAGTLPSPVNAVVTQPGSNATTSVATGGLPGQQLSTTDLRPGETRPDVSNPARAAVQEAPPSRVQAERAALPQGTPPATASRPDTSSGHLATSSGRPTEAALSTGTRSFLMEEVPAVRDVVQATPVVDPAPHRSASAPAAIAESLPREVAVPSPVEPVRFIPLPGNGGAAFVPAGYADNVASAFPEPRPGTFRVITQHRDGTFALPGDNGSDVIHRPTQFSEVLGKLPATFAAWSTYSELELIACDLTPAIRDHLAPMVRTTLGVDLTTPYLHTPVHITPDGEVSTADPGVEGTLHLAPKRRRDGSTVQADPDDAATAPALSATAADIIHQHGDLEVRHLVAYVPEEIIAKNVSPKELRQAFKQERVALKASGDLWRPIYRGNRVNETLDTENFNDFTAWVYRKVVADPRQTLAQISRSAQEAGFAVPQNRLLTDIKAAIKQAEKDGRRYPELSLPNDNDKIVTLVDQLLTNGDDRSPDGIATELKKLNVRGSNLTLKALATSRERELEAHPELQAAARQRGLPSLRPTGQFLGRALNADQEAHHGLIEKLAYAAAWERKTADTETLTDLLIGEGVGGAREVLQRLVGAVIDEADHNGDRLRPLSTDDPGHYDAIRARTGIIFSTTFALNAGEASNQVKDLVKHMRIRHISGRQQDLEAVARTVARTADADLSLDFSLFPIAMDTPSHDPNAGNNGAASGDHGTAATLASAAERTILQFGDLESRHLVYGAPRSNFPKTTPDADVRTHLAAARAKLKNSDELWRPLYRGEHNTETFDQANVNDLTAWLYRRVTTNQDHTVLAVARSAAEAGFSIPHERLEDAVKEAMKAAEADGRRRQKLSLSTPSHREEINSLIDRLIASGVYPNPSRVATALTNLNVTGSYADVRTLVRQREDHLNNNPDLLVTARDSGHPASSTRSELFFGRKLNADHPADHPLIDKLAYAAAWEEKTADTQKLAEILQQEGVAGSYENIRALVTAATEEADRKGDRLLSLSSSVPGLHNAIGDRTEAILNSIPAIREAELPNQIKILVRHMRTRHITGSREDLEDHAIRQLQESGDKTGTPLDPVETGPYLSHVHDNKLDPENPAHAQEIRRLARKIVDSHGNLGNNTLAYYLHQENVLNKKGTSSFLTTATIEANHDGSLWNPRYRGAGRQKRKYDFVEPNDFSALLWRLAVDHPHETKTSLARRAEHAGYIGHESLLLGAKKAITVAVLDQRRYPLLNAAEASATGVIDTVIADYPDLGVGGLLTRLRDYNVRGNSDAFAAVARARAAAQRSDADIAAGRQALTLRPDGQILGRYLDVANEADLDWIDKLAYATAWTHKTDTVDQLIHRLEQDGITNTDDGLRPLVTRIIDEATTNGDRYETLSTDHPAHHDAILHRTGTLALKDPKLVDAAPPDAITTLVRHMRVNHITGAQEALRGIANTILSDHAALLPGNSGMAFVASTYSPTHYDGATEAHQSPTNDSPRQLVNTIAPGVDDAHHSAPKRRRGMATADTPRSDDVFPHHGFEKAIRTRHGADPDDSRAPGGLPRLPQRGDHLPGTHGHSSHEVGAEAGSSDGQIAAAHTVAIENTLRRFGDLDARYLANLIDRKPLQGPLSDAKLRKLLGPARINLRAADELWSPLYRGVRNTGTFAKDDADDLTVWLYRRVIAEPRLTVLAIARSAASSGFITDHKRLESGIRDAIEAAVSDGRRHPELTMANDHDKIIHLIDRLLANSGYRSPSEVTEALGGLNIRGAKSDIELLVTQRQRELKDQPELLAAAQEHGLPTLPPTTLFLGRVLDAGDPTHHDLLDKLAYAAAWENKNANVDQLIDLLQREGVTDTGDGLRPLVTRIVDEATANGDRYEELSTDRHGDHAAILHRAGALTLKNLGLFDLTPIDAITALVRHMRVNHIIGTREALRDIAETVLTVRTDHPLPGTHTVPILTYAGQIVEAIPLPRNSGMAFVSNTYAPNVNAAFSRPRPGVINILTHHDTTNDVYYIPDRFDNLIPHHPTDLAETFATLPLPWHAIHTLNLWACNLTIDQRTTLTNHLHQHPTLRHLTLTSAYLDTPIHITPAGTVTATDPGVENTLHLAPKRRRDGSIVAADPDAPETAAKLAETTRKILQEHGDLDVRYLLRFVSSEVFPARKFEKKLREYFARESKELKDENQLWRPIYHGKQNKGNFNLETPDDLTVWLYRKVVSDPNSSHATIARSAQEAGFVVNHTVLTASIRQAIEAATNDGRRHPYLSFSEPGDRDKIEQIIDQLIINYFISFNRLSSDLSKLSVHGTIEQVKEAYSRRNKELDDNPELVVAAHTRGFPKLPQTKLFFGRILDVENADDHAVIEKLAYAIAWEKKEATVPEIVTLLKAEGIEGSAELLSHLVIETVATATRNGDRLPELSASGNGHAAAISARTRDILIATPGPWGAGTQHQVNTLVQHMRMRHITGPQADLAFHAHSALTTAMAGGLADVDLDPIRPHDAKLDHRDPVQAAIVKALARTIVDTHGYLENETLRYYLYRQEVAKNEGISSLITDAVKAAQADGSLWQPRYRGHERQEQKYDAGEPNDLTALLWQSAIRHPRETATELARRAVHAGFIGRGALISSADSAIDAVVRSQRRHPFLSVNDQRATPLVDALIADNPGLGIAPLTTLARTHNIFGTLPNFTTVVRARAAAQRSDADIAAGRQALTLRPDGQILGRYLDVANEADLDWIDKLAYATAWTHKTDTVDQLIHRLEQDGITNTDDGLRPLVTRIIDEATTNGDRYETLSTDHPAHHDAILHRTGTLVLKNPDLFDLTPPDATTTLVRHMRVNHITGTTIKLRRIANTILDVRTDQPLPGAQTVPVIARTGGVVHAIPLPRNGGVVHAIPLPRDSGVAFVDPTYTPNVNAAFAHPGADVVHVLAHHDTADDTYYLPTHLDNRIPYSPLDFADTIAGLPITWNTKNTLNIWACNLTLDQHTTLTNHLYRHPALHHLTIVAAYLNTPIYIAPDGTTSTVNPFVANTLFLGVGPDVKRGLDNDAEAGRFGGAKRHQASEPTGSTTPAAVSLLPPAPSSLVAVIRDRLDLFGEAAAGGRPFHPMLGPDLFGLGRTPEAPEGLSGVDYDGLSAAQGVTLLRRLDLTRPFPDEDTLTPESLADGRADVLTSEWTDSDRKHWEHEELDWDTLPARRETPKLLHGIWLGGPLADGGTTGIFQQGFAESARKLDGQAVLWTDVPRRRFEAALANASDASYAGERQMARWARSNGISLVNVDEVFNAEAPMRLDSFYRAELTKGTPRGYAAASDSLRVHALARFGGLYLDGDDRLLTPDILLRVHESPLGFGVSGVSGAAWSVPETMWNNNGLAWAKGHPMAWVYLDVLERSYRLPQAEVFPDVLAKAEKESFVTPFGRPRRHSVLWRTGPQLFPKLRDRTGEFAPLTGITHNSLSSWVPGRGREAEPPRITAADPDGTALLTAKVIQTLVRELANRQGDLHLTEVADLVERHETPAAIWSAALGYFADTPLLRERVRTMTADRYQHDGFATVSLPAETAALLLPREGERVEFLGETVVPITMRASSGRAGVPNEIDWPSPPPARDLAETVLAKRAIPRSETASVRETPAPDTPELVLDDPLSGRAPDAGQAHKLTELTRYLAEQSILRTRRGFPQPSVELRVAGDTSGAERIQRQLIDQTHRLRGDASAPDPTVRIRQVPEVAAGRIELRVDWELRGSGSSSPAPFPASPVAKPLTITTDLPPVRHPILDDHGWRHSTAATADWMTDPAPLTRAELDAARDRAEPVTVRAEDTGPQVLELQPGRTTEQWWQPIAYDYRRFEARPGKWVQEYTVRLDFVSAPGFDLARYLDRAQGALDRVYNHRYRLPTGDAFHLRVQHDPSGRAHGTVTVTTPGTRADQLHWPADIDDLTLAHEFGHFTGLHDEYVRLHGKDKTTAWALRGPKSSRVVSDDGLYTRYLADYLNAPSGRADLPVPSVKPRNLWLVEHRARTLGATTGISTGSPATMAGTTPDPVARLSALAAQAKRHLAALPESIAQGLRARIEDQRAGLVRPATDGLSPRDLAGLAARIADLEQVVAELREARLRQLITLHEAAVSAGTRGENPLRSYPDGVPGGVTSRPDARFGLEFEFQLRGADFGGQIGSLGRLLETNGIVEWNGGARFDDTDTDPTRWTLVEEPDLDAGAELRSPILRGVPKSWRETGRALRLIGSHRNSTGGEPDTGGVGGHVNVSFDRRPDLAVYGRLAQLTKVFEDVLYRLGNHSGPGAQHRRLQPVGPNALPLALSDITSADDVRALNTTKDEAVSFRNVDDEPGDRVEFRFWAGGLSVAEWQARAEISGALRLAAEDPALDGRLRELLTKPRLVGHTPAFPGREAELAYLLDFLELLPLSRAAEELAVVLHARTRPLSVTAGNDPRLVAQTVVGPGGRGWSFPGRGTGIPEALHATASLPRYPGAEIVAATLTAGQDAVDLWTADPVPFDAFGEVLQARNPTFGVPGSELPPGGSARLVLAVPGGAAKLGPVVSNAIDEPVVATDGRLWFTADGRLETDSEWVELVSGSVRLRSGHSDLGMALALMTAMDPDHSESPAGAPSEQLPLGPALPEAPDFSFLPEIVPDPQSFTQQVITTFDDLWRTGERTEAIESAPTGVLPLSLSFAETATTVIADGFAALRPTARAIAQAAVARAEQKTPGLEVTVTTYSGRPGAASLQRAAQVRALLRAALAEELAARADGPVRLEDIEIHAETANNPDGVTSDGHHHVVVETSVAVTRSAAEDSTFKTYDSVTHGLASLRLPKAEVEGRLAEFSELASGGRLEHHPLPDSTRGQLIVLNETLAAFGDAAVVDRVRALVNEAVLAASLVPVREQVLQPQQGRRGLPVDRRTIQPVTPARLTQLMDELTTHLARGQDPTRASTSAATGMTITPGAHLAVRLASLGLVNLSASSRAAVTGDPLYRNLLRNPDALTEALFAGTGHEEQRFLNTCAPAAIDTGVRGRVPTIAGLLSVGRAVADATDRDLLRVDPVARSKRDRPFGRTLEAMVRKRVSDARAEFSAIEEAAFALVSANQADPSTKQAWNALSDRWGRTMQKLSAADLQAVSVPVLTRKVIPGDWLTSLILTSPLVVDRGARRLTGVTRSSYVARLQPHLAFEPDGTMFGANELIRDPEQEVRLGEELTSPDALAAFWAEVRARGGTVVLTPGHCVQLGAAISDGEPVFVLGDGKYANSLQQTPEQFARWAKSWDARTHSKLFPTLDDESKSGSSDSPHTRVSRS